MSEWAILQSYGFEAIEVLRESNSFVTFHNGYREKRAQKIACVAPSGFHSQGVLPWRGNESEANALVQKLASIKAEKERRQREATQYMERECAKLLGETE